jgi:hypothetical protein
VRALRLRQLVEQELLLRRAYDGAVGVLQRQSSAQQLVCRMRKVTHSMAAEVRSLDPSSEHPQQALGEVLQVASDHAGVQHDQLDQLADLKAAVDLQAPLTAVSTGPQQ